jgi:hypothetical protein
MDCNRAVRALDWTKIDDLSGFYKRKKHCMKAAIAGPLNAQDRKNSVEGGREWHPMTNSFP